MSKQSWETMYEERKHGTLRAIPSKTVFRFIKRIKDKLPKNAKILDIGCGRGVNTEAIKQAGYDAYGCDIAENAVEDAKKRGINAVFGDMYYLPYKNKLFDAVYTSNTLKNEKAEIEISLKEINRVLKNNGFGYLAFFEKVEYKNPYPNKPDEFLPKEDLHKILLRYFRIIDNKYDIWTDSFGVDGIGEKGEHTHYRTCLFVQKS